MAKAKGISCLNSKFRSLSITVFFCPTCDMFVVNFARRQGFLIEPDFELAGGLTLTCTVRKAVTLRDRSIR